MRGILCFVLGSVLLTSCASIINQPQTGITIRTNEPSTIVYNQDTIVSQKQEAYFKVPRSSEPIEILTSTDQLSKTITIEPKNSFMYWGNILFNYGAGMIIDNNNPKRYTYPHRIFLDMTNEEDIYITHLPSSKKGDLYFHLSLPYVNSFLLQPEGEAQQTSTGFLGLSLGLDYYHRENQFLHLDMTGTIDFFMPFPVPVDFAGEQEFSSSNHYSLSNNHRIKRFSLGYGLVFARNTWELRFFDIFSPPPPTRDPVKTTSSALGLIFPSYYQVGRVFKLGLIYRPTFYRPNATDQFRYEHLISIDLAWSISLKNRYRF